MKTKTKNNSGPKHQHLKAFIGTRATLHLKDNSVIMNIKIDHMENGWLFYKAHHKINSLPLNKVGYATPAIDYNNI